MKIKYPKQYFYIGNKTVLEHSVSVLFSNPLISRVVIAINPQDTYFSTLTLSQHPQINVVNGGKKRVDSVLSGIQSVRKEKWVLIHDAVRPCLHKDDLARLLTLSKTSRIGGILATPVQDTMKRTISGKKIVSHTISRLNLWHALTPQIFPHDLLQHCLLQAISDDVTITDEASALEYCGFYPEIVEGRSDNIKVTRQEDLQFVEFYLARRKDLGERK